MRNFGATWGAPPARSCRIGACGSRGRLLGLAAFGRGVARIVSPPARLVHTPRVVARDAEVGEAGALRARVDALAWAEIGRDLDAIGHARVPELLTTDECVALADLFGEDARFRKTVDMQRHRFGVGAYRYFNRPLPAPVEALRRACYPHLARIANDWQQRLGSSERFEGTLPAFLARCAAAGQRQPTPLLLRYEAGGFNCLHQDLYGAVAFPLQLAIGLSRPDRDFRGGEFLLVEGRARQQSRGEVIALRQGEAAVFPTRERPVESARGTSRAQVRHGISRLHAGIRVTLGIIFHDAES